MGTRSRTVVDVNAVAVYCRLSKLANAEGGLSAAIPRQERAARRVVERKWGAVAVRVYADDDVSAWSGKRRPAWEEMLADVRAGDVQAVVAYDLDRLYRQPRDLEDLFDVCDAAGVTEMATAQGEIDLGTSNGRLMARMMGAVAAKSSDDTSRRLKEMNQDRASRGEAVTGHRAFGWIDKATHDPDEALIVRELVGRFLAGDSLTALANDLNRRGIPTPRTRNHEARIKQQTINPKTGEPWAAQRRKKWASSSITCVLRSPRNAGLRSYKGEVVAEAEWPPIISRADHERVLAILNDPSRRTANPPRRTMLTGLVVCGICGLTMVRGTRIAGGAPVVKCAKSSSTDNCGGVSISGRQLERIVLIQVFDAIDSPEFGRVLAGNKVDASDETTAELVDVEGRLAQLVDMFAAGEIDRTALLRGRKNLEGREKALRASLGRQRRTSALDSFVGKPGALKAGWEDLPVDRQRAILAAIVDRVVVNKSTVGRGASDPTRVKILFRS